MVVSCTFLVLANCTRLVSVLEPRCAHAGCCLHGHICICNKTVILNYTYVYQDWTCFEITRNFLVTPNLTLTLLEGILIRVAVCVCVWCVWCV